IVTISSGNWFHVLTAVTINELSNVVVRANGKHRTSVCLTERTRTESCNSILL
ncbi:GSCOCG00011901001-RA-CDS, partial [Cotesia congregata]